jgi:hypothetical protein
MRRLALGFVLLALVAGCGGGNEEEPEASATPEQAVAEIDRVRDLLGRAVDQYRNGNAEQAEELVADAYLEHFEHVEHPLEERDRELMEELEVLISTTTRNAIKEGAPMREVERLVDEATRKLDEAERLLKEG